MSRLFTFQGVIISSQPKLNESAAAAKDREANRKSELKQIKRKYGISKTDNEGPVNMKPEYSDRADQR